MWAHCYCVKITLGPVVLVARNVSSKVDIQSLVGMFVAPMF